MTNARMAPHYSNYSYHKIFLPTEKNCNLNVTNHLHFEKETPQFSFLLGRTLEQVARGKPKPGHTIIPGEDYLEEF